MLFPLKSLKHTLLLFMLVLWCMSEFQIKYCLDAHAPTSFVSQGDIRLGGRISFLPKQWILTHGQNVLCSRILLWYQNILIGKRQTMYAEGCLCYSNPNSKHICQMSDTAFSNMLISFVSFFASVPVDLVVLNARDLGTFSYFPSW